MNKKRNWWILGVFLVTGLLSFIFDKKIIVLIASIKNYILTDFLLGLTFISSTIIIFFFLTALFLYKEHKRRWILPLWLLFFISSATNFILKFTIRRLRPFQEGIVSTLPILIEKSHLIWNFSFPSNHAMLVFATLPLIAKEFPKIKWFWIVFAIIISFSRIYFGVHYLSDVIFGGIIGYLLGMGIVKLEEKYGIGKRIINKFFRK